MNVIYVPGQDGRNKIDGWDGNSSKVEFDWLFDRSTETSILKSHFFFLTGRKCRLESGLQMITDVNENYLCDTVTGETRGEQRWPATDEISRIRVFITRSGYTRLT